MKHCLVVLVLLLLAVSSNVAVAQDDGQEAFESFAKMIVGGTWTTTLDGEKYEDTYRKISNGQFIQQTAKGSKLFPGGVSVLGIDPETNKFTWWGFNADGSVTKGTMKSVSKDIWQGQWASKGPKGTTLTELTLKRIDKDTLKVDITKQEVTGEDKEFPAASEWKRVKRGRRRQAKT